MSSKKILSYLLIFMAGFQFNFFVTFMLVFKDIPYAFFNQIISAIALGLGVYMLEVLE